MPNLFALQGPGNCGKSATLTQLFQSLQNKYSAATIQTVHSGSQDIAVIMHGVNGLVVGIESQGDPNSRLQQSLSTFAAAKWYDCWLGNFLISPVQHSLCPATSSRQ